MSTKTNQQDFLYRCANEDHRGNSTNCGLTKSLEHIVTPTQVEKNKRWGCHQQALQYNYTSTN